MEVGVIGHRTLGDLPGQPSEGAFEALAGHADLVVVNDGTLSDCVAQVEAAVRDCLGRTARR